MFRRTTITIILLGGISIASILDDPDMQKTVGEIISMRFVHKYEEADSMIVELREAFPFDPAPLFLRGSNLQDWMLNNEDYRRSYEMNAYLDSAIALSKSDTLDPWNLWVIGSSYGYKAISLAEQGKYIQAFGTSSEAMEYYERAYDYPAVSADAALGMGGYSYWKSAKLGILTYLPFVDDNKEEGIELLNEARWNSIYSRDAAIHALVYIYCEENMIDSARVMRNLIEEKYPGSLLPLWYDLAIYEAEGNLESYLDAADQLSLALDTLGEEQVINRVTVHLLAANAAAKLEDWAFVCLHCTAILEERLPSWVIDRSRSEINDLKDLAYKAAEEGAACPKFP